MLNEFYDLPLFRLSFFFVGGEGGSLYIFRFRGDELRLFTKFHRPIIWVAPDASPAIRYSRLLCSPNLNPYVALRDRFWRVTICLLLCSKLYPYTRTYVALHLLVHNSTSDVLFVSSWSYFYCSSMLPVFWIDGTWCFRKKKSKILGIGLSSDQQIQGDNKLIVSAKYQTGTIGNDRMPTKPSEFCLPFFIGAPLHACCIKKLTRTLYYTTLSTDHCVSALNY